MQASAASTAIWLEKLTHDPNDKALTFRPDFPKRRYSISIVFLLIPPDSIKIADK